MRTASPAGQAPGPTTGRASLFAEDFDAPAGVIVLDEPDEADAEPPPVVIDAAMVEAVRAEALAEGRRLGRADAAAERETAVQGLLTELLREVRSTQEMARECVEGSAEQLARLVFGILDGAFPGLCQRHGGDEIARFTRQIVGALEDEQQMTIRVHPSMADDVERALAGLEAEHRARIAVDARDAMPPGAARISWRDATAERDPQAMWSRVHDMLAQFGLTAPAPILQPEAGLRVATAA